MSKSKPDRCDVLAKHITKLENERRLTHEYLCRWKRNVENKTGCVLTLKEPCTPRLTTSVSRALYSIPEIPSGIGGGKKNNERLQQKLKRRKRTLRKRTKRRRTRKKRTRKRN
jgi:hypothetical protein